MKASGKTIGRLIVGCVIACCLTSKIQAQPILPGTNTYSGTNYLPIFSGTGQPPLDETTNLWIEFVGITNNENNFIFHNTQPNLRYQLFQKYNLTDPEWIPAPTFPAGGTIGTNVTPFFNLPRWYYGDEETISPTQYPIFFMAYAASNILSLSPAGPFTTTRPASQNGSSQNATNHAWNGGLIRSTDLAVTFQLYGSAIYGVDYTVIGGVYSNSTVMTTIPAGGGITPNIVICPLYTTNAVFGTPLVTLSLALGGSYDVDPEYYNSIITIDPAPIPMTTVTNLPSPFQAGIDYQPVQNALILSVNSPTGETNNFILINTNNDGTLNMTNWSNVAGVPNEVELTTVKITTNNLTLGDTYFNDGPVIDKLTANGIQWTYDWCSLTNAVEDDSSGIAGLHVDETGTFGGNLIVATIGGGIWSIQNGTNGNAYPTLLTNITVPNTYLSGVTILTNDTAKWGPWAGKILTGDVNQQIIYAIDTNGVVTSYSTSFAGGIAIESFGVIPPNEDLYYVDAGQSKLMKISRAELAPYVGDLVISQTATAQAGPGYPFTPPATLFIIAWDPTNSVFEDHAIPDGNPYSVYEDVTFAPIDLPSQ